MGPPPVVTGISPKEGPPGTRVTVRGEFLGNKAQELTGYASFLKVSGKTRSYKLRVITSVIDVTFRFA